MTNSKFLLPIHCDEKFFQLTLYFHRSVPMTCWHLKEHSHLKCDGDDVDGNDFLTCYGLNFFLPVFPAPTSTLMRTLKAAVNILLMPGGKLQGLILSVKRPWTRCMNQSYTCQENMVWNGNFQLISLAIHTFMVSMFISTLFRLESPTWQPLGVPATRFRLTKTLFVILKGKKFETRCLANSTKTSVNLVEWYKT